MDGRITCRHWAVIFSSLTIDRCGLVQYRTDWVYVACLGVSGRGCCWFSVCTLLLLLITAPQSQTIERTLLKCTHKTLNLWLSVCLSDRKILVLCRSAGFCWSPIDQTQTCFLLTHYKPYDRIVFVDIDCLPELLPGCCGHCNVFVDRGINSAV